MKWENIRQKLIQQMTANITPQSEMRKDPNLVNTDMSGYGFMVRL